VGFEPRVARQHGAVERVGSERKRGEWSGGGRAARPRGLDFRIPVGTPWLGRIIKQKVEFLSNVEGFDSDGPAFSKESLKALYI
jgi:hypothetical protein